MVHQRQVSTSLLTACLYLHFFSPVNPPSPPPPVYPPPPHPIHPPFTPTSQSALLQVHLDLVVLLHCLGLHLLAEAPLTAAKLAVQNAIEAEASAATAAAPQMTVSPPTQPHTVAHPPNHPVALKQAPAPRHAHRRAPASSQIQAGGSMLWLCQRGFSQWMRRWIWIWSSL